MRLTKNFELWEFVKSDIAARHSINNNPPEIIAERLLFVARQMESVRASCGNRPVIISSGYRSPTLNTLVRGSKNSAHIKGYAVDFRVAGLTIQKTIELIAESPLEFDQLINEFDSWVHISFEPRYRRQVFKIG